MMIGFLSEEATLPAASFFMLKFAHAEVQAEIYRD